LPAGHVCLLETTRQPDCLADSLPDHPFCFTVTTPHRVFYFSADSGDDMYDWVQILRTVRHYLCCPTQHGYSLRSCDITQTLLEQKALPELTRLATLRRKFNGKVHMNCIHGAQVVDLLIHTLHLESRAEAAAVAQILIEKGLLKSLAEGPFSDSAAIYQCGGLSPRA